jgi:hypothetical protein
MFPVSEIIAGNKEAAMTTEIETTNQTGERAAEDVIFDRKPAQLYLKTTWGITANLAQEAHHGTGPRMIRRRDGRIGYRRKWLDEFAKGYFRVVSSSRDKGRPLTKRELTALVRTRRTEPTAA